MKFIHRLGYYLGGFALGLIILAYFFSGKKTSCAYGPTARTLKNINLKEKQYSVEAQNFLSSNAVDTADINKLMKYGAIDFGQSETDKDSCNIYIIRGKNELKELQISVENCEETATILEIEKIRD